MNWEEGIELLQELIAIPSYSRDEGNAAECVASYLQQKGVEVNLHKHNVWAQHDSQIKGAPTLLLNSHIDTVKAKSDWTIDPFTPALKDGKLFGLGSNDAGGPLVSLIQTFLWCKEKDLPFNVLLACTAEEEISGANGIAALKDTIQIDFGIIGEPTLGNVAVAEKGLMVIDGVALGESGHAARNEGTNAIYKALADIQRIDANPFDLKSEWLGPLKMSVTQIEAGTQHNVVPDTCKFVIDVRTTEHYPNEKIFEQLQNITTSTLKARSFRLNPSFISLDHPLVKAAKSVGCTLYGSPTLSDQSLLDIPTIKMGPGDSARSHTANEYIEIIEIKQGIQDYIQLIQNLSKQLAA